MRLLSVLLQVLIGCCGCGSSAATLKCGKINGVEARTLRFPGQITFSSLDRVQAKARFKRPDALKVAVGKTRVARDKIEVSVLVRNTSRQPFPLVVNPYGGSVPYGGDSPLSVRFSRAASAVVRYSGRLYPPEPPKPMVIQLPAASCTQFDGTIDLSGYSYKGAPEVTLDWAFYFFSGEYPKGTLKVRLPRR